MAPVVETIEIARSPEEVFPYVIDPSTFVEWQDGVRSGTMNESPTRVGSRCTTVRRIGGSEREFTTEITEYDPPHRWADHGLEGPIRAVVGVQVEPAPSGSRVTIAVDFEGHGIGKLLVPLVVRRQAAKEMPGNLRRLKERLER
jgi:uncharacterized protein YndB with AHSA1/START domain